MQLGHAIPREGEQQPISWDGIDRIYIQFSESVSMDLGDVSLEGVNVPDYLSQIESLTFDETTFLATIQLSSPLANDRILLNIFDDIEDESGNFLVDSDGRGGTISYPINVLPGDVTGNALVDTADILATLQLRFENITTDDYDVRADFDGSGIIDTNDLLSVYNMRFSFLPPSIASVSAAVDDTEDDETDPSDDDFEFDLPL